MPKFSINDIQIITEPKIFASLQRSYYQFIDYGINRLFLDNLSPEVKNKIIPNYKPRDTYKTEIILHFNCDNDDYSGIDSIRLGLTPTVKIKGYVEPYNLYLITKKLAQYVEDVGAIYSRYSEESPLLIELVDDNTIKITLMFKGKNND